MAAGMNACKYSVDILRGILNLSLLSTCLLSTSCPSGCVSSAKFVLGLFAPVDVMLLTQFVCP